MPSPRLHPKHILSYVCSQLRYVHYFDQLLQRGPRDTPTLRITALRLVGCPDFDLVSVVPGIFPHPTYVVNFSAFLCAGEAVSNCRYHW